MVSSNTSDKAEAYLAALREFTGDASDLDLEIKRLQSQRAQITEAMKLLRSRIQALGGMLPDSEPSIGIEPTSFLRLTVRDAIKSLFRDYAKEPLTTAEIKARLEEGGISSKGADFLSNVSATLSVMSKTHKEVERDEKGRWQLAQAASQDFDPGISDDDVPF